MLGPPPAGPAFVHGAKAAVQLSRHDVESRELVESVPLHRFVCGRANIWRPLVGASDQRQRSTVVTASMRLA